MSADIVNQYAPMVVGAIVVAVLGYLAKQLAGLWSEFKFAQPNLASTLEQGADLAVHAAEQIGVVKLLAQGYSGKRAYALAIAQKFLDEHGLKGVSADLTLAAIERAVLAADFPHAVEPTQ
jgi:hypothetical protein